MTKLKLYVVSTILILIIVNATSAQTQFRVVAGIISLNDLAPTEKKYASLEDSLDKRLKVNSNDTTSLFYRALLYLQFNSFIVNPDFSTNRATVGLLTAKGMVDRADSLKMKCFELKVLRAQLCKELTNRYAPIEIWRFSANQVAERQKKYEFYKDLANSY